MVPAPASAKTVTDTWQISLQMPPQLWDDAAAKTYAKKCRELAAAGPGAAWDGIWNLTEK